MVKNVMSFISTPRILSFSKDSSFDISGCARGWPTEESEFNFQKRQKIFLSFMTSRPALVLTEPPIQWVMGPLSPGIK
jgi:hypothetical protein